MTEKIRPMRTYEAWPKEEKQLPVSQHTFIEGIHPERHLY